MAAYSDIELGQAQLLSQLSGRPARVKDDVFVWNGYILDRPTAVIALLKVYSTLPVTNGAKERLYNSYYKRFQNEETSFVINKNNENSDWTVETWFYKLCKRIKGKIDQRSNNEIKEILIYLHS